MAVGGTFALMRVHNDDVAMSTLPAGCGGHDSHRTGSDASLTHYALTQSAGCGKKGGS